MSGGSCNVVRRPVAFVRWIALVTLVSLLSVGDASTHWMVTEDGKIQAQADSIFNLQCPYDVMVLLNQERRKNLADAIRIELLNKDTSETLEEKDMEFEREFYSSDPNCTAAGKPLLEFDLYAGSILLHENKGLRTEGYMPTAEFRDHEAEPGKVPLCSELLALEFSMHAFEHLGGMAERENLTSYEEVELLGMHPHTDDLEKFGSYVAAELEKNASSWIFYNLATYYWRTRGNSLQAVECIRRSLHLSPREFKDIALVSLSSILHRNHRSGEAAVVLHAALDISNIFSTEHFALGNIYAVLGDFNKSVACFENALRLDASLEEAKLRKNAVVCREKFGHLLESRHKSLQKTLDDLKQYQARHEAWQTLHRKILSDQLHSEARMRQAAFYREHLERVKELTLEPQFSFIDLCLSLGNRPLEEIKVFDAEGRDVASLKVTSNATRSSDVAGDRVGPIKKVVANKKKKKKPTRDVHDFTPYLQRHLAELSGLRTNFAEQHASNLPGKASDVASKVDQPYMLEDWPSEGECNRNVQHFPMWSEFQTVFLSLQKKGFDVSHLLGPGQGLEGSQAHPFPWYPPLCTPSPSSPSDIPEGPGTYDHISAVRDRASLRVKLDDSSMKEVLVMQVVQYPGYEITLEEIGQRILTALKNNVGPPWILYNLAGLFWRVSGNPLNGIECIRRALHFVPRDLRDVPSVNLASVLYKVGRVKDAVKVMKDALAINSYEADSLFFMGNLLAALGNITGAVSYYHDALRLDPTHDTALKNLRMILCLKKFHLGHQTVADPSSVSETLDDRDPDGDVATGKSDPRQDGQKCSECERGKIQIPLVGRHGNDRICAIPISEQKLCENAVGKDCFQKIDDFSPSHEKFESCHKIPTDVLNTLSACGPTCDCQHPNQHGRQFNHRRQYHRYHQQQPFAADFDSN